MRRIRLVVLAGLLLALCAAPVLAAEGSNAQLFQPALFGGNFVAFEDSHTLCNLGFGFGLYFNYANRPVEVRLDKDPRFGILNTLLTTDLMAAFGPAPWLSIGADMPFHLLTRGRTFGNLSNGDGMTGLKSQFDWGDLRMVFKFRALEQEKHWLGMAITPYLTFPTGDTQRFLGEGRFTGGGTLTLEHDFKALNVALNGGYLYRGNRDIAEKNVGDAWKAGAGISRAFSNGISFSVEYWASWVTTADAKRFQGNPMEVMATLRYSFGKNLPRLVFGGSGGLTSGVGSPAWRGVVGADYFHCRVPKPPKPPVTVGDLEVKVVDEAGKPLEADLKVEGPTPTNAETDAKGLWKAPKVQMGDYTVTATKTAYQPGTEKGTVYAGKKTSIVITLVKVPTNLTVIVVDKYTGAKLDASVVFDQGTSKESKLAVPGEITKPWLPGAFKMIVSAKGYEDVFTETTVIEAKDNVKKVELRKVIPTIDNIYFDYDSDVIRKVSYVTLDDVVAKIKHLGQFKRIIVQGHCSSEGTDEYNMDLSRRRATSVKKYLSKKGIPAAKIEVEAYGESRPLVSNDTEEGRAKNRRVMFIIEEQ
jgi:outer membrane protein OmpA-like peptidoglycan-associated protein